MRRFLIAALAVSAVVTMPLDAQARLRLMSNDVHAGARIAEAHIFNAMGCTGKNISPELHWTGAPLKTRSFALTVYDPDAQTGSGWWHWVSTTFRRALMVCRRERETRRRICYLLGQ
jgi:Raf kinase inhibitor-like protein, YbhB/YbcL family